MVIGHTLPFSGLLLDSCRIFNLGFSSVEMPILSVRATRLPSGLVGFAWLGRDWAISPTGCQVQVDVCQCQPGCRLPTKFRELNRYANIHRHLPL